MNRRWLAAILLGLAAALLLAWLARATIAARVARAYFQQHGVESSVEIGALGLSGVSGRFALGPRDAPDVAAEWIELYFDPLSWIPKVVEVRLVHPMIRARLDAGGKPRLGSLQEWIDSLSRQQGKSRFVSDDLAVSLSGLRLLLATPGGALEVDGDVKLIRNLPVTAVLKARPATIFWQGARVDLRIAELAFDNASGHLALHFQGGVNDAVPPDTDLRLEAGDLKWQAADGHFSITAPSAHLQLSAASLAGAPKLDVAITHVSASLTGSDMEAQADLKAQAAAGLAITLPALRSSDPALASAITRNLAHLDIAFAGHFARRGGRTAFALSAPLIVKGASGGKLDVAQLAFSGAASGLNIGLNAALSGGSLPAVRLAAKHLMWSGGGLTGDAALNAHFDFAMLHGADISAGGTVSWQAGRYAFVPMGCAKLALAAFRPAASDLAKNIHGLVCGAAGAPLITGEGPAWKLSGEARDVSADLPPANARVESVTAHLAFEGEGAPRKGVATVTAARLSDGAVPIRFKPMLGSGTAALADGAWRGRFAMTDPGKMPLGDITFSHVLATGAGTAHIAAPAITFALDKLQPENLSPLLAPLRRAEGSAAFTGDIGWTRDTLTSQGKLSIASLDFMTPLGKAHAVKSDIAFTSLLPPVTAPGQGLAISRIDWTLPFSAVSVRFGFSPTKVEVGSAETDIAQGHAALGAFTINLADPGRISGTAKLTGIALNALVAASNLGAKVKLEGKVSGSIPFALGPDGFRIANGHVAADGPGRLSVDRGLWAQGDAALSSNAVQDFAYQALENLAFEQMSADLNSVAGGRLQVVFHIKGKSDPPKPQVAEVAIADILNGTALYKPILLPSGTPIDLTLDTSLNFDELLKSYAEAWSKSLSPEGAPDITPGAKP